MCDRPGGRSYLACTDFDAPNFGRILERAARLKAERSRSTQPEGRPAKRLAGRLAGRSLGLVFEANSTRTRLAFDLAAQEEGATVVSLDTATAQLGRKETLKDTARVLGRMVHVIACRGPEHRRAERLAAHARVPVINALTDRWHPTQMLADDMTMREHANRAPITLAFIGDGRCNVAHSLPVTAALLGFDLRIVAPARPAARPARPEHRRGACARHRGAAEPCPTTTPRWKGPASSTPMSGSACRILKPSGTGGSLC